MRLAVIVSLFAVAAARPPLGAEGQFEDFVDRFGRKYASEAERQHRFEIFAANLAKIEAVNEQGLSYKLGVTATADLTFEEFRAQYLTGFKEEPAFKGKPKLGVFRAPVGYTPPDSIDWVAKGGVTPVQNQAHCGSCWTFSTTGALEGATFISRGTLPKYSEQNLLDCDTGGDKCQGGSMSQAFGWVKENGICLESDYPYVCANQDDPQCVQSTCSTKCKKALGPGDVTGYTSVDPSENALEAAVAQQPVAVAIEADKDVFQHYVSGILSGDACGSNLDHGVLAVGYGTDGGKQYWKVKNSWGTTFGEQGYIRLARGDSSPAGGECGIRKMASYPTVTKTPGPAPGPAPGPPGPPSPGCEDQKDYFCSKVVKELGLCKVLAQDCLETCGCCVTNAPDFCKKTPAANILV